MEEGLIKYESIGNINWYAKTLASKVGAIVPQNLGAETQDKMDKNFVCWMKLFLGYSDLFGWRHWNKHLDKELRNEPLVGIPFLPYKCFPPKSVKTGATSCLFGNLSIWRILFNKQKINKIWLTKRNACFQPSLPNCYHKNIENTLFWTQFIIIRNLLKFTSFTSHLTSFIYDLVYYKI